MSSKFRFEPLSAQGRSHLKKFDCGSKDVNGYFHQYALKNSKSGQSSCHLLLDIENEKIAGFYTLSASSISFEHMPENGLGIKIPKYPIPTALIGYLGVDIGYQNQGLAGVLVVDAIKRAHHVRDDIGLGILAIVVDPINEKSEAFFRHMGFEPLHGKTSLFIPLQQALARIQAGSKKK